MRRPMLKPTARRLWRSPDEVQLGADPAQAVVLRGLAAGHVLLLDALDGAHDRAALTDVAAAAGLRDDEVEDLLHRLGAADVLADAAAPTGLADQAEVPPLLPWQRLQLHAELSAWSANGSEPSAAQRAGRRRTASVRVVGADRVGALMCTTLASVGVGAIEVVDDDVAEPGDVTPGGLGVDAVDQPRAVFLRQRLEEVAPQVTTVAATPSACVLVGRPAFSLAPELMRTGVPHLLVDVRAGSTLVGPFVYPGRSACLSCLDQLRTDRDPSWPLVVAQLSAPHRVVVDLGSALVAAGLAVQQVLLHLDGARPTTVDAVVDVRLPDATTTWRSVSRHPACGCDWSHNAPDG